MILALARPQRSVAAPQRAATVVLVNDVSGSMRADDVAPSRLTATVTSAKVLVDKTPDNFRLGLVTFADYAEQVVAPTMDHGAVEGALERMVADGGTAMGDGLARGLQTAQTPVPTEDGKGTRKLPAIIVLLSDGKNTLGSNSPLEVAEDARAGAHPDLRDRARHGERRGRPARSVRLHAAHPGAARQGDAARDREHHRRALLRGRERRRRRGDLQQDRHPADLQARAARDHGRVRRRRRSCCWWSAARSRWSGSAGCRSV